MSLFCKKVYNTLEELQKDLDEWLKYYNEERPHSGARCYGKTPAPTFAESKGLAKDKQLDIIGRTVQVEEVSSEVVG